MKGLAGVDVWFTGTEHVLGWWCGLSGCPGQSMPSHGCCSCLSQHLCSAAGVREGGVLICFQVSLPLNRDTQAGKMRSVTAVSRTPNLLSYFLIFVSSHGAHGRQLGSPYWNGVSSWPEGELVLTVFIWKAKRGRKGNRGRGGKWWINGCGDGVLRRGEVGAAQEQGGTCGVRYVPGLQASDLDRLGGELGVWF